MVPVRERLPQQLVPLYVMVKVLVVPVVSKTSVASQIIALPSTRKDASDCAEPSANTRENVALAVKAVVASLVTASFSSEAIDWSSVEVCRSVTAGVAFEDAEPSFL